VFLEIDLWVLDRCFLRLCGGINANKLVFRRGALQLEAIVSWEMDEVIVWFG